MLIEFVIHSITSRHLGIATSLVGASLATTVIQMVEIVDRHWRRRTWLEARSASWQIQTTRPRFTAEYPSEAGH